MTNKVKKLFLSLGKIWMIYVHAAWNIWRGRSSFTNNSRLLIIQLNALGDSAILVPAVSTLIDQGYKVDIICKKGIEPLWNEILPRVKTIPIEMPERYGFQIREIGRKLRSLTYEAIFAISSPGKKFGGFLASCPQTKHRFLMTAGGRKFSGASLIFNKICEVDSSGHDSHSLEKLFSLYLPGFESHFSSFKEKHSISGGGYLVIHPGGKWIPRRWPKENFLKLIYGLSERNRSWRLQQEGSPR